MLFVHKTNIKKLAIILIGGGLLAACNQAGNSSISANATTQHATVASAKRPQKMLRIINHSGSIIDHFKIVSKSGEILFQSNTGLECMTNQDCSEDINNLITSSDMVANFYNNKHQLVAVSALEDNLSHLTHR